MTLEPLNVADTPLQNYELVEMVPRDNSGLILLALAAGFWRGQLYH
jgi:hypothetical protein